MTALILAVPQPAKDALHESLSAFTAAAVASQRSYTVSQLVEMVEIKLVNESGGIVSWVKRKVTGADSELVSELRAEVDAIRTAKDKTELLRTIDNLLGECADLVDQGNGKHALTALAGGVAISSRRIAGLGVGAIGTLLGGIIGGTSLGKGGIAGWAAKRVTGTAGGAVIGYNIGKYGAVAYGSVKLLQTLGRIYSQRNGTLEEYVSGLKALREEVSTKQISQE